MNKKSLSHNRIYINTIAPLAIVKVTEDAKKWYIDHGQKESILVQEDKFIFLGEIPNMPGHCVIASMASGKVYAGFHTEKFVEVNEEET